MQPHTFIEQIHATMPDITPDSTISRTVHDDDDLKVVIFGFDTGQELSEHTASMPAVLHFIQGEVELTLGSEHFNATQGSWAHMPAHLSHSIKALKPTIMLLYLLKK
ncbi:MAG: cupin domain-containing protein [Anaerolineales bacterium]|jgi:quercetin dioxygenase-like cupin family protein